ncbi:hypothetical protein PUN28_010549 [Cardiocondyla obscurior]|uniref:Uncharacterized protein n=1 Tax=Cardiocondyla obscurior TaxID=286306 RepID=A0AAW2FK52_9HYME
MLDTLNFALSRNIRPMKKKNKTARDLPRPRLSLSLPPPPSWGKSHASRFYECFSRSLAPSLTPGRISRLAPPSP